MNDMMEVVKLLNEKNAIKIPRLSAEELFQYDEEVQMKYAVTEMKSQQYGKFFENKFIKKHNLEKNNSKHGKGDFNFGGCNFEYKVSVLNETNKAINIVQIRPQEEIHYYIIQVVNAIEFSQIKFENTFFLTQDQIIKELKKTNNNSAHGNKERNKIFEYRMSIKYKTPEYDFWNENYSINDDVLFENAKKSSLLSNQNG